MSKYGLYAKTNKKSKYKSYAGEIGKICDNIINRDFHSKKMYEKAYIDVTEFKTSSGQKVYLSILVDGFNQEIIGKQISTSPNLEYTLNTVTMALNEKTKNMIIHSDQGWQYQHKGYQNLLKENNIIQSMSRKGNSPDNGLVESVFGHIKREMYRGNKFTTTNELITAIDEYIDYYNYERINTKTKGMSPVKFRLHSL